MISKAELRKQIEDLNSQISSITEEVKKRNTRITTLEKTNVQLLGLNEFLAYNMENGSFDVVETHVCKDGEKLPSKTVIKNGRTSNHTCAKCGHQVVMSINAKWKYGIWPKGEPVN